jgi:hypothetical protein
MPPFLAGIGAVGLGKFLRKKKRCTGFNKSTTDLFFTIIFCDAVLPHQKQNFTKKITPFTENHFLKVALVIYL